MCVQDDSPPYRYVSVEGPVVSEEELDPAERLAMARRYLGQEQGDAYIDSIPDSDEVVIRITPERWVTVDFGKEQG